MVEVCSAVYSPVGSTSSTLIGTSLEMVKVQGGGD